MRTLTTLTLIVFAAGCGATDPYANTSYSVDNDDAIQFADDLTANTSVEDDIADLKFTNKDGQQIALKDYLGQRPLVLVITRGYSGAICPYCATQTSRLIANYDKFRERDTEVVVVYPLEKPVDQPNLDMFMSKAVAGLPADKHQVPFPVLLDVELKAVNKLGIRKSLSKPATYIFDREGKVQFAYVGSTLADRPSVKALLAQLDRIGKEAAR